MSEPGTLRPAPVEPPTPPTPSGIVLLHLWRNRTPRGRFEAGKELTESGMVRSLGLPVSELRRILSRLELEGNLTHRLQYVVGYTEMKTVYHLTRRGEHGARQLEGRSGEDRGGR